MSPLPVSCSRPGSRLLLMLRLEAGLDSRIRDPCPRRINQMKRTALARRSLIWRGRPTRMLTMPTHRLVRSFVAAFAPRFASRGPNSAGWNEFKKLFQSYVDSDKVVGASVVILKAGRRDGAATTPVLRTAPPTCASTRRRSTTGARSRRRLTAISIMQLRDRGKLSLDDKIVRWVPELRTMHDPYGMMDSITHPDAAVAHRRISESDLALRQRPALGAVRADDVESARRDDAVPAAARSDPARATATRIPASSTSRA